ncbi:hypothetical protein AOE01nite_19990 [Acetobacter oeni]|uniref:Uncharacterized protein n=1 Tax=Acetobacter oeni TaxID=304077 RepID=A0A511XLE9_9PROT|nr:hypothetical protein AA21952_0935 [Acetobacter oeni LMG 21952]GEN63775.1 hypothetical protein AOE01nite_19990 [Acetobacter oeni]
MRPRGHSDKEARARDDFDMTENFRSRQTTGTEEKFMPSGIIKPHKQFKEAYWSQPATGVRSVLTGAALAHGSGGD